MHKKEDNLKEIDDLINTKREDLSHSYEYRNKLLESVKKGLSDLNISSIKIGNETLSLAEKNKNFSSFVKDENYFTSLLNEGLLIFILNVNTDTVSYSDIQSVLFENQKIDDLIDKEMVMSLAPTSTIYAPKDKKPWSEFFKQVHIKYL